MTILVTGSTGALGWQLVAELAGHGAPVRALSRNPEKTDFPAAIEVAKGDLTDIDSVRTAMQGIRTLFLLNGVVPDELTQGLTALNLAREAGIERIVYLSVLNSDRFTDVPHFNGKYAIERMIEQFALPATILRPSYFMQNDAGLKDALLGAGLYPMPLGSAGTCMADIRDIVSLAATSLLERDRADGPLPSETIEIAAPDALTGDAAARLWSEALGRPINYAGDDLNQFEGQLRARMPAWAAFDLRMMLSRFHADGMRISQKGTEALTARLGRAPRSYGDFVRETAAGWKTA